MKYIFYNFPIPPSTNQLYKTLPSGKRCKSKKYKDFITKTDIWSMGNIRALNAARDYFNENITENNLIKINMYICLMQKTVYSQRGTMKRYDASNRIKATHDYLSKMLNVDDTYFSVGVTEKIITRQREQVIIELQLDDIKKLED